jgi:RNA polymerase sigma-70 factor (ECF subfamily)
LQLSEIELVRAAAKGDAEAFRALTDRHIGDLFRLALSLSGRRADAEDICQETLVGAFKGAGRFDGRSSFKTWMTRILLRQAAKNWKKEKRRNSVSLDSNANRDDHGARTRLNPIEPRASVADVDVKLDLLEVIKKLGPDHQQIVVLRELQGLSYEEISQTLGIPCGTVESRLFRARIELRKLLKDYDV